jgi:hypothetical protein
MKAFMILGILLTLGMIFLTYRKDKEMKKLLLSLGSFSLIISLAIMGNLTRPVLPIYLAHLILVLFSWMGLWVYMLKRKYYWWVIVSPIFTIGLFLLLEFLTGSSHSLM